jgi:4-amino-4-deoxy-L-arabinose transferase-like glycosyltransferase
MSVWGPVALAALLLLPGLGNRDLWGSDETRYAVAAREILESGDWMNLTVNGRPYEKKPPLLMWMQAGLGRVRGGIGEVEARLPGAAAGVACVALTGLLATLLFGRAAGFWAALFLAVTPYFAKEARTARMDVLVTLAVLLSFAGFALWERRRSRAALLLFLLPLPLGVLAKWTGPLFVLPPLILYVSLLRRGRRLPWPVLVVGAALSCLPLLFFGDAAEFGRIATGKAHARAFWMQIVRYPLVTLPFFLLVPVAIARMRRGGLTSGEKRGLVLVTMWVGWGLLMLTVNGSKRSNYLDPLIPPAMLLAGWIAAKVVQAGRAPLLGRMAPRRTLETVAGLTAIGLALFFFVYLPGRNEAESVGPLLRAFRDRAAPAAQLGYGADDGAASRQPGPELVFYAETRIAILRDTDAVAAWLGEDGERYAILRPGRFAALRETGRAFTLEARPDRDGDPYFLVSNRPAR